MVFGLPIGIEDAWLIPVFPLIAFPIILLIGSKLRRGGGIIAVIAGLMSLIMSLLVLLEVAYNGTQYEHSIEWITFGDFVWEVGILVDSLSALMTFIVTFVGFLVIVYSLGYMKGEEGLHRYFAEVSLFIGVMLGLTLSNNLLQMFIFWELVGVCSFLLIGFWYKKPEAASAAKKAFLVTRIGDIMFLVGVIMIFNTFDTFNFTELEHKVEGFANIQLLTMMTLLLFGGAVGKSAQFPLHVWLPDAMEGPTTVSALIHAATMVKAGVFLVARSYFMFTEDALSVVAWLGAITAFMAASMALVVYDIKRVLAYSTISQLGFMMLALGTGPEAGGYTAGMFHLMNHAFFKALLFLCAGSVIHAVHTNDMRKMGGLLKKMPITGYTMLIGTLSIAGVPLVMSGFWSKDEIFVAASHATRFEIFGFFNPIWFLAVAAAVMTSFYMFRMWFMTFSGKVRTKAAKKAHESPLTMTVPLMILAGLAICSGFIGTPWTGQFQGLITLEHVAEHHFEMKSFLTTLGLSTLIFFIGFGSAYALYVKKVAKPGRMIKKAGLIPIYKLLLNKYYMDYAEKEVLERKGFYGGYRGPFIEVSLWFWRSASEAFNWFDKHVIDGAVNGIAWISTHSGKVIRKTQTGLVNNYATMIVIGLCILMIATFGHDMIVMISDTLRG